MGTDNSGGHSIGELGGGDDEEPEEALDDLFDEYPEGTPAPAPAAAAIPETVPGPAPITAQVSTEGGLAPETASMADTDRGAIDALFDDPATVAPASDTPAEAVAAPTKATYTRPEAPADAVAQPNHDDQPDDDGPDTPPAPPEPEPAPGDGFKSFGLSDAVMRGVIEAGYQTPSPIQRDAIPVILKGRDVIGQAHTGTGKTAAFGLPSLSRITRGAGVGLLVITPTRELANQVSGELYKLGQHVPVRTLAIYGGQPYAQQLEKLRKGAEVVVATPGRLLDILESGRLREPLRPAIVVLDEADEMLDMGVLEDVEKIFSLLSSPADGDKAAGPRPQTLLFSATMPRPIQELANRFLTDPVRIQALDPNAKSGGANRDIEQLYYVIAEHERDDATVRLIDTMEPTRAIVFCRTKREVDRLAGTLASRGASAQPLHGDMDQSMRERAIGAFRAGEFQVLVATDVAARGLDVPDVSHVFNYHIPFNPDSYVHRIGRTGRAGRKGVAVTLVTPHEHHELRRMQAKVGMMENRLVPTHQDLKRNAEARLLEEIRNQPVDADAEEFLDALADEMGLPRAACKLLALLMGKESATGPDRIGVTGARLERLHQPERPQSGPGGPRGGKPYRGNKPSGPWKPRTGGAPGGKPSGGPGAGGGPKGWGAKPSGGSKPFGKKKP